MDPKSRNVLWGPDLFDGKVALNRPEIQMIFAARSDCATIFLRAMATDGSGGENRVWFDATCMEPRLEIPPYPIAAPMPPPTIGANVHCPERRYIVENRRAIRRRRRRTRQSEQHRESESDQARASIEDSEELDFGRLAPRLEREQKDCPEIEFWTVFSFSLFCRRVIMSPLAVCRRTLEHNRLSAFLAAKSRTPTRGYATSPTTC